MVIGVGGGGVTRGGGGIMTWRGGASGVCDSDGDWWRRVEDGLVINFQQVCQ